MKENKDPAVFELKQAVSRADFGSYVVYGAHNMAGLVIDYFAFHGKKDAISAVLVTSRRGNPIELRGVAVEELEGSSQVRDKTVIIAMPDKFHAEVKEAVIGLGCQRVICFTDRAQFRLFRDEAKTCYQELSSGRYTLSDDPLDWQYMNFVDETAPGRFLKTAALPMAGFPFSEEARSALGKFDMSRDYASVLGAYTPVRVLPERPVGIGERKPDFIIYAVHSEGDLSRATAGEKPFVHPLQAGAAIARHRSLGSTDDTGDNISSMNRSLAEMTAVYWVWKHLPDKEYVGVCHYRRHFALAPADYERLAASGADAVLTVPRFVLPDVKACFEHLTAAGDASLLLSLIKEHQPEYYADALIFYGQQLLYPCNIFILDRVHWADYGEFVFSVLLPFDEELRKRGRHTGTRFSAYWGETLTSLYFMHNKDRLRIVLAEMELAKEEGQS